MPILLASPQARSILPMIGRLGPGVDEADALDGGNVQS
jgi:hypothetical protein